MITCIFDNAGRQLLTPEEISLRTNVPITLVINYVQDAERFFNDNPSLRFIKEGFNPRRYGLVRKERGTVERPRGIVPETRPL